MHLLMWSGSISQLYRAPAVNATGIYLYKKKTKQLFFTGICFIGFSCAILPFYDLSIRLLVLINGRADALLSIPFFVNFAVVYLHNFSASFCS